MTDPDAHDQSGEPASGEPSPSAEPTVPELLLALQEIDTEADQLAHRKATSPLRDEFTARSAQLTEWERRRSSLSETIDELGVAIERCEARSAELLAHRQKLEQQMKTVIAPREAEALTNEIATIESERDTLDLEALEALEQQSALDDERSEHLRAEEATRDAACLADETLGAEVRQIDASLDDLSARRGEVRSALPDGLLATYDRKRSALGVAVARLVGKQCQGCHLELSPAEIDTVREEAADTGVTDCPDCGRLLIV